VATVRDFNDTHPDFEPDAGFGIDPGIVAPDLGADDKPVYAGGVATLGTHGMAHFDEWYRDAPGDGGSPAVNMTLAGLPIPLVPSPRAPGIYAYDNDAFFPIDGRLFGNQGRPHNFDFTLELVAHFRYAGGETFSFTSDDDSWVFLNRKLAVDLGGIHSAASASVNLDLQSQRLGIAKGGTYAMHLFYAERHVVNAVLHIDVTAADFALCSGSMP
jgi:fibro-slime domain-containing protein